MKGLSEILLLLGLQSVTTLVLAAPPSEGAISPQSPSHKKCVFNIFAKNNPDCPAGEFCGVGFKCEPKKPAGAGCYADFKCLSGYCDSAGTLHGLGGVCAQKCSEESPKCPPGTSCRGSFCIKANQPIGTTCFGNDDCESKTCLDSKCQPPNAKKVGDDCTDQDSCQLGSMCWKGSCSTRGYKSDGTLGGSCIDQKGQYQCLEGTSYCDWNAAVTCQPKRFTTEPCGLKLGPFTIPVNDYCFSGRCLWEGFCGPEQVGGVGEPCSKNESICLEDNACLAGPGDGVTGPKKTCQAKGYENTPCKKDGSCKFGLVCYHGNDDTATCVKWGDIQDKPCKSDKQCNGGLSQTKVWTNYGAFDGVDGGWGTKTITSGYTCSSGRCNYVYKTSDDTKSIPRGIYESLEAYLQRIGLH